MNEDLAGNSEIKKPRGPGKRFKKGVSGNPAGRPKLPEEIRAIKEQSLQRAVEILHNRIGNDDYISDLRPSALFKLLEIVFDRFGLPKVTKQENALQDREPLIIRWQDDNEKLPLDGK